MPKSITAVLLDKYPENPSKPLEFFKNHADHMHRFDGATAKSEARKRYLEQNYRWDVADKIRPRNA